MAGGANANTIRSTQLGIQNTLFTGVGANVLLTGVGADVKPVVGSVMLPGHNTKVDVGQVATKGSHTTGKLTGWAGYNDLAYIISLLAKAATITTPVGATTARDWTWILMPRTAETPKFATLETGIVGTDLGRVADVNLTGLKLTFEQNKEVAVDADLIGTLLAEENVTATASPTEIVSVPLSVNLMDAYVADSVAGLSGGLLGAMYKSDLTISNRRKPIFPIRSDRPSWGGVPETKNTVTSHIEIEHDTQSYLMMRQMRASNSRFLRYMIGGPEIEPGFNYELAITQPFKVTSPDRGANDEVYQGMYDLSAIPSADTLFGGGFMHIRLRCSLAALAAGTNLASDQQTPALISGLTPPGFS